MTDLAHQALDVNQAMLALGNEVFEAEGATFVRNRALSDIRDSNHVSHVSAATPEEIGRLLARVEREFAGFPHRRFDTDNRTPPEFEARLALDGYQRGEALVMILEGDRAGTPKPHDIRLVEGESIWSDYTTLNEAGWLDYQERIGEGENVEVGRAMLASRRAKSPPARHWLAYADDAARAYLTSWEGIDGVGQVEDLFTQQEYRHRGLATALIHHCVADCRAHGAGAAIIVCDPDDTPKEMYAAMGFRPIAIKRSYWKASGGTGRRAH